jgi:hypothetical protein
MTLDEFVALIVTVDSSVRHFGSRKQGNYTVWAEYDTNSLKADDKTVERALKVQIDRFTKTENDSIAAEITAMLDTNDIAYSGPLVDYEQDTGYIHHIWSCEVE